MNQALEENRFRFSQFDFPLPSDLETNEVLLNDNPPVDPQHLSSWPVVYILTNQDGKAYIGETTNYKRRMNQHKSSADKPFDTTLIIDSPVFNQSTTFDYENRLIELFLADEKYRITNKNNGYCSFNYYQRPQYRQQFRNLWRQLKEIGYAGHPIEEIENSDLYKYSPFKGLTPDQYEAIENIFARIKSQRRACTFVNGVPGTGKSILAISLLFKLRTDEDTKHLRCALVAPMDQLRKTYKQLAQSVDGLRSSDIIGPSDVAKKEKYDVLLIDEAHRMHDVRGAMGVPAYWATCDKLGLDHSASQWDWMLASSKNTVFFFDPKQQVRATGMGSKDRDELFEKLESQGIAAEEYELTTQMRVHGGDEYLDFIYDILTGAKTAELTARHFNELFSALPFDASHTPNDDNDVVPLYQLALIDSFADFCELQQTKERECGLSRMVAGYAWAWASKKDSNAFDIEIDGIKKRWNSRSNGNWAISPNAYEEVGSIHTVQGYDLNYTFVIIGDDLRYDPEVDGLVADKASFKDVGAKKTASAEVLQEIIINAYYVLLTRGIRGTFIFAHNQGVRQYLKRFIPTIWHSENGWRIAQS